MSLAKIVRRTVGFISRREDGSDTTTKQALTTTEKSREGDRLNTDPFSGTDNKRCRGTSGDARDRQRGRSDPDHDPDTHLREQRTDLRTADRHASWREVYYECGVEVAAHE